MVGGETVILIHSSGCILTKRCGDSACQWRRGGRGGSGGVGYLVDTISGSTSKTTKHKNVRGQRDFGGGGCPSESEKHNFDGKLGNQQL